MNLLRRLKLRRVALVEAGANPGAHITLFKSKHLADAGYDFSEAQKPPNSEENLVPEPTAEQLAADLEKSKEALAKAEATAKEAEQKAADAEKKLSETDAAELEKARATIVKLEGDLAKSKDADVQKQLDETKDELAKLRKAERSRTFVEKAKSYEPLPNAERLAPLLDEADEKLSEASQKILDGVLKGASEAVEKGALFAQLSDPDASPDESFEVRLEKAARELMKTDESLTIEQAKQKAMHADADLRKAYAETRS